MVNTEHSSVIYRYADRIHQEMSCPDAGTERRLFELYRLASANDQAAVVLAMIGELLVLRHSPAREPRL